MGAPIQLAGEEGQGGSADRNWRDHLDTGSGFAQPRDRGNADGSDAIAMPLLNALLNTACGAQLGLHSPWGRSRNRVSIHAGMVAVADGSER